MAVTRSKLSSAKGRSVPSARKTRASSPLRAHRRVEPYVAPVGVQDAAPAGGLFTSFSIAPFLSDSRGRDW